MKQLHRAFQGRRIMRYLLLMLVCYLPAGAFAAGYTSHHSNSPHHRPSAILSSPVANASTASKAALHLPQGRLQGSVKDTSGAPMPGVTVSVKGTNEGTTTDDEGKFVLNNVPDHATILFSSLGYDRQTVHIQGFSPLHIVLTRNASALNEVVVVSYGTQKNREVTGSISQLNAAKMKDMPVGQFSQQLQGKVAGMQVQENNGEPGQGMQFRIRGAASLSSGNQPLIVVDGIPITGSINNIDPSEIETFTVLKDASASSLYGSRAANGVILITTKHAKPGENKVEFDGYYGTQIIPQQGRPKMMTAREFAQFENEYYEDRVKYEGYTGKLDPIYANPDRYGNGTNWFDVLTRTAPIQSYNLTVSSANDKHSSTVMAGYFNQQGVVINTGTQLYSLRANESMTLGGGRLKIGFNLAPSYQLDHNNRLATQGVNGLFEKIVEASPLIAPVDSNGHTPLYVQTPGMVSNVNPYAQFTQTKDDYKTTRILGNTYLNYKIFQGLMLNTNVALDMASQTRDEFKPSTISTSDLATGISSSTSNYSWTAEADLQYDKTIATDHHLEALLGYSAQKFNQESNSISGTDYPNDAVPWLDAATSITDGKSNTEDYSLLSAFGRLNYNYKGKYLVSAAMRRDGSSRFGENKKYGNFPSLSLGWMLSDEPFMKRFGFLDMLKIRASYGLTGNNNIGNYTYIPNIGTYNYIFNGTLVPGATISTLGNSDLAWERNKQFDIGLDLSLWGGRISFTYDYYHKITDGMIQARPIPRASGFSTITTNIGAFEFWGHEFSLSTVNLTGRLKWNSSFNISFDRNLVKSLLSPGFIRRNNTVTSDYYRNQVGHPLSMFYGFVFEGLYKDQADLDNSPKYATSQIGTIKMKDVNGDDTVTNDDRTFIGDPNPKFTFGFTNNFEYGHFDLSITMSGSVGGQILNASRWAYLTNLDGARMLLAAVKDRWRSPEDPGSGVYPRTMSGTTALGRYVNSQWLENGSFLTVKNIALGYTIDLGNNLMLKSLRVYGSVQQALILTGYSGLNPEISLNGLNGTGIGVDENAYPVPRTFSIGFNATFK